VESHRPVACDEDVRNGASVSILILGYLLKDRAVSVAESVEVSEILGNIALDKLEQIMYTYWTCHPDSSEGNVDIHLVRWWQERFWSKRWGLFRDNPCAAKGKEARIG
jgi:hypothetical protein